MEHEEPVDQEAVTAVRAPSRVRLFFVVGSLTALIHNLATLWALVLSAFLVILVPLRELRHAEGQAVGELVDRIDLMMMQAAISIGVAIVAAVLNYLIGRRYRRLDSGRVRREDEAVSDAGEQFFRS